MAKTKSLIIVESPAKTKTLKNFLGDEYQIEASMGHVRDLPAKELGVDLEKNFAPKYESLSARRTVLDKLKTAASKAETVYLATDPDREGEAIAWHLNEALHLTNSRRIEFNEITRAAVQRAMKTPRGIDMPRVNAQQARRVLDRLVGYQISPLLWRKLSRNSLSAGRVQSVAVKLIVDREREIRAFVPEEYWTITARLTPFEEDHPFDADLRSKGCEKLEIGNEASASKIVRELEGARYLVDKVETKRVKRSAPAPFITSTLQQEAARKLGFNARHTMRVAQQLYEGVDLGEDGPVGLITYMRTDSIRIADEAKAEAREFITARFGTEFVEGKSSKAAKKGRVQDAHEAVRPTDVNRDPASVARFLERDQQRLYELIWNRFVASQMADALFDVTTVDIQASGGHIEGDPYIFRATGSVRVFAGWSVVYLEGKDNGEVADEERPPLPAVIMAHAGGSVGAGESLPDNDRYPYLKLLELLPGQHFTQPPPRYTEATLVKTLEQNGVGRPSTYAAIVETIRERKYVEMEKKAFRPTPLGETVNDYLVDKFKNIVDVSFTAFLETELDKVAEGDMNWVAVLKEFYEPFSSQLAEATNERGFLKIPEQETDRACPNCGKPMVIKHGRRGEFLACTGYPECKTTLPVGATGTPCPECGEGEIIERKSKRGKVFYGCNRYPNCAFVSWDKPTGQMCPDCKSPLVEGKATRSRPASIKCSNKECDYTAAIEDDPGADSATAAAG